MLDCGLSEPDRKVAAVSTLKKRKGFVDAKQLAKNWSISKELAQRTIEATTQRAIRDLVHKHPPNVGSF